MESTGELAWFRSEVLRSLFHPFDFARSLAREHYGLAGVLVAIIAGFALSIAIDSMILTSKSFSPFAFLPQVLVDSVESGRASGRTPHFRIVHLDCGEALLGRTVDVEITGGGANSLQGRLCQQPIH